MLHVGINGQNLWWGEGEVKFYMDGDKFPTICGIGTEDYFGGAYGWDINGRYTPYSTLPVISFAIRKEGDKLWQHTKFLKQQPDWI